MAEPGASTNGDPSPPHPAGFDDPALEAAFGLDGEAEWIQRARTAEIPGESLGNLGPYQILEEIGRGGQGVVFRAVQPGTGRIIALKRLSAGHHLGARARARFAQEVQALARLSHPCIVAIHAAEVIDGSPALLMEYVAGATIERWADGPAPQGPRRPVPDVLDAFAQVCDAVAHAHQRGVIHRDLKPSNVLVDAENKPFVLDFGIAKLVGEWQAQGTDAWTVTGFAGTPAYTSPEQLERTHDTDTRTDVYSLGVLLYRLLTGVEPFGRNTPLPVLIDAVRSGVVRRPSLVSAALPKELDWVVAKAMERDPAGRYQTVESFAEDVRRFSRGEPVMAHPPSRLYTTTKFVRRHLLASAATAIAMAVILVLAGVLLTQALRLSRQNADLIAAVQRETTAREEAQAQRKYAQLQASAYRETTAALEEVISAIAARVARVPSVNRSELFGIIEPRLALLAEPEALDAKIVFHLLQARIAQAGGRPDDSLAHWRKVMDAARVIYAPGAWELAKLQSEFAGILSIANLHDEALAESQLALQTTDSAWHFQALVTYGTVQWAAGLKDQARVTLASTLEAAEGDRPRRMQALETIAQFSEGSGQHAEALEFYSQSLAEFEAAGRGGSFDAARVRVHVARLMLVHGRAEEAEPIAALAVKTRMKHMGPMHVRTQEALLAHAEALSRLGRFSEAAQNLELLNRRMETIHAATSQSLARHRFNLAAAQLGAGAVAEARRYLALAVSLGSVSDPADAAVANDVDLCASVLKDHGWQVDPALAQPLGTLAWLVGVIPEAKPDAAEPDGPK